MYSRINHIKRLLSNSSKTVLLMTLTVFSSLSTWAAGPPKPDSISNPMVIGMMLIICFLLLAIILLANILSGAATHMREVQKKNEAASDASTLSKTAAILTTGLLLVNSVFANGGTTESETVAVASSLLPAGVDPTAFYFLAATIAVELMVVFALLHQLRQVLLLRKEPKPVVEKIKIPKEATIRWWNRLNSFKPIEEEAQLDLDHEYDGIRELDNRLPPWWLYGFYLTIVISGIYMWRYHVAESAPLSKQEFEIAMAEAEVMKVAYLKKSANNVDENTVKLLSTPADLANGKKVYDLNCAACHGKAGEGTVGPNLTDEYWLHGGSLGDVFKSIKYGWADKGMKSWKDDFSPIQIAQLSSYIYQLQGTNPANAKEPQGPKYQQTQSASIDSADNRNVINKTN